MKGKNKKKPEHIREGQVHKGGGSLGSWEMSDLREEGHLISKPGKMRAWGQGERHR